MKSKIEKDKVLIMNEIADARAATDEVMRAQASADMSNKKMLETLNAINKKVDDANLTLGDFASNKNKISCENSDLLRIVGDLDNNLNILAKQKAALAAQLNDVKALCANEARERVRVLAGDLVLVGGEVSKSQVGIVNLLVDGVEGLQHLLVGHVGGGLSPHHLVSGGAGVSDLVHDENLV